MVSPAQTPIEEFTPTPAFPALQYLESVDEGGVAWRAGLRMGDFLIEVRATTSLFHYFCCKLSTVVIVPGQRAECGEGWSQTGGQHDPARWQQPHGQGRHGYPQPRHG